MNIEKNKALFFDKTNFRRIAQIGIVSAGLRRKEEPCNEGTGIYERVSYYKQWIRKHAPGVMDANCKKL